MKLPIKHEFFEAIKRGDKTLELRDAHITFIDETTGEKMIRYVIGADVVGRAALTEMPFYPKTPGLINDKYVLVFALSEERPA